MEGLSLFYIQSVVVTNHPQAMPHQPIETQGVMVKLPKVSSFSSSVKKNHSRAEELSTTYCSRGAVSVYSLLSFYFNHFHICAHQWAFSSCTFGRSSIWRHTDLLEIKKHGGRGPEYFLDYGPPHWPSPVHLSAEQFHHGGQRSSSPCTPETLGTVLPATCCGVFSGWRPQAGPPQRNKSNSCIPVSVKGWINTWTSFSTLMCFL